MATPTASVAPVADHSLSPAAGGRGKSATVAGKAAPLQLKLPLSTAGRPAGKPPDPAAAISAAKRLKFVPISAAPGTANGLAEQPATGRGSVRTGAPATGRRPLCDCANVYGERRHFVTFIWWKILLYYL